MIKRYEQAEVTTIWSDENKLKLWQKTELAVIKAKVNLGEVGKEIWVKMSSVLRKRPDVDWWLAKDKEIHHDLNAFIEERVRHLPLHLRPYFHGEGELTSYDVEEPAFAQMLKKSIKLVEMWLSEISFTLKDLAQRYRYTPMMGRTHGQEAELQTFGKRCLTWFRELEIDFDNLKKAEKNLKFSKISGAIGNYGSIDPEVEKEALKILGFKPFYGATQILPRELYTPIAEALCQIVMTLDKIATDIRLGARSGQPIYQEPFGKKQKGSSRMPHKKNTISTEQIEGMARMAKGFQDMIMGNIKTWEERAIEQSSVERVAWPDLFHIVIHSLKTMTRVLKSLAVYPDNMLREVIDSRGCYASGEVKKFLGKKGVPFGLSTEEAYRIVQLAAFNTFEPPVEAKQLRENPATSLEQAGELILKFQQTPKSTPISIEEIILRSELKTSTELEVSETDVQKWNGILREIFRDQANVEEFHQIFSVPYLLRNEAKLYQEILGI
jgi:adenylosuccinate lyase